MSDFTQPPGKGKATASLVLGILSIVYSIPPVGLTLGIIGLVQASRAKKAGFTDSRRTGGFVCSLIGTIISGGILLFVVLGVLLLGAFYGVW